MKTHGDTRHGQSATYDCFECAIHDMAPSCAHCAREHGVDDVTDNSGHETSGGLKPHHAFI